MSLKNVILAACGISSVLAFAGFIAAIWLPAPLAAKVAGTAGVLIVIALGTSFAQFMEDDR